ncbi:hypothetical protein LINGRAHAP2_LOCUS23906, partial [Linum grandiflorum]
MKQFSTFDEKSHRSQTKRPCSTQKLIKHS